MTVYQALSSKIKELKVLGLSNEKIASSLRIDKKTAKKGLDWDG